MKQQLLERWQALQKREQQLLLWCAVALGVAILYWGIWQPVTQYQQTNQQRLVQAQQQLTELQQALPTLQQAGSASVRAGGSLSEIITNSARSQRIQVSRMQPQNDQLQLVLEDTAFDQLLQWLHQLQYQHGVKLVNLDLTETDKTGIVRVRRMVVE